jgi:NAD+ synthase
LGLPKEICEAVPTTDTYSLEQGQDEFYFALPYQQMDQCLWAFDHGWDAKRASGVIGLTPDQVERVDRDIQAKRRVAQYLHHVPRPLSDVPET